MHASTRLGLIAGALAMISSAPAPIAGAAGSSFGPVVRGRVIWDSSRKGTFNAGRNAAKRAANSHQKASRAAQVRNAGWHEGSGVPISHRSDAKKRNFSKRVNLLADRRLRQIKAA